MGDYQHMSGKPNYKEASDLASELMERFLNDEIQQVEMLYNHFKSTSTQILTRETYLLSISLRHLLQMKKIRVSKSITL